MQPLWQLDLVSWLYIVGKVFSIHWPIKQHQLNCKIFFQPVTTMFNMLLTLQIHSLISRKVKKNFNCYCTLRARSFSRPKYENEKMVHTWNTIKTPHTAFSISGVLIKNILQFPRMQLLLLGLVHRHWQFFSFPMHLLTTLSISA